MWRLNAESKAHMCVLMGLDVEEGGDSFRLASAVLLLLQALLQLSQLTSEALHFAYSCLWSQAAQIYQQEHARHADIVHFWITLLRKVGQLTRNASNCSYFLRQADQGIATACFCRDEC